MLFVAEVAGGSGGGGGILLRRHVSARFHPRKKGVPRGAVVVGQSGVLLGGEGVVIQMIGMEGRGLEEKRSSVATRS